MYISEALVQKHQRRGPKQTGKFLTVLRMFPPTVSSHKMTYTVSGGALNATQSNPTQSRLSGNGLSDKQANGRMD